ncbi:MAG: hypothetical protein ABW096_05295 [Candidatus Thiodiazotropha sp.]
MEYMQQAGGNSAMGIRKGALTPWTRFGITTSDNPATGPGWSSSPDTLVRMPNQVSHSH